MDYELLNDDNDYSNVKENKVKVLDLTRNLQIVDCMNLYDALKVNTSLTTLILRKNYLGDTYAIILADILYKNTLEVIDLSHNIVSNGGARSLSAALISNTSLKKLDLSFNEIQERGAFSLAVAIRRNKTLKLLDVSHNFIEEYGLNDLSESLQHNNNITLDTSYQE